MSQSKFNLFKLLKELEFQLSLNINLISVTLNFSCKKISCSLMSFKTSLRNFAEIYLKVT